MLAANLMTMLLLKRRGVPLDRDVIFLAESGEEADPTGVGINYMVREHFDEIDAEFAMTEGGGATHRRRAVYARQHRHRRKAARAGAAGGDRHRRPRVGSAARQRR